MVQSICFHRIRNKNVTCAKQEARSKKQEARGKWRRAKEAVEDHIMIQF